MIELLLPLQSQDYRYLLCTEDKVFLAQEHSELESDTISQDSLDAILQESLSFEKSKVQKMVWNQKSNRLTLYMRDSDEHDISLHFGSTKGVKRFIAAIPDVKEEEHKRNNAMPVLIGIWLLLTIYAFLWAGTRESPEDVDPRGIRLRIAYFTILLMQKLVMTIGQTATLWIGIVLLFGYIWLFYEHYLRGPDTIVYHAGPHTVKKHPF